MIEDEIDQQSKARRQVIKVDGTAEHNARQIWQRQRRGRVGMKSEKIRTAAIIPPICSVEWCAALNATAPPPAQYHHFGRRGEVSGATSRAKADYRGGQPTRGVLIGGEPGKDGFGGS